MSEIRLSIERWFESLARFLIRFRWVVLVLIAALVAGLGTGIPKLTLDTSSEGFLHPDDPVLAEYEKFKDQFGRDDMIIIAVEPDNVFSFKTLKRVKALHDELEDKVPHLNDIISMVNARNTVGRGDRLIVDDLLADWPRTEADLAALKERVMANRIYRNRLINDQATMTAIVLEIDAYSSLGTDPGIKAGFTGDKTEGQGAEALSGFEDDPQKPVGEAPAKPVFLTDEENRAVVREVNRIVAAHQADGFKLHLAGSPVVSESIKLSMMHDMGLFMRLAVAIIGITLFFMFRRITGVVLPLLIVLLALVSTLGLMGYLGVPFKTPTMILPSFILAVGVGAAVHILALFYQALQRTGDKNGAIAEALGHSGLAVVMTSLTTAVGMASFTAAEVAPIADLGLFASAGIIIALVYTIVLLPILLALVRINPKAAHKRAAHPAVFDSLLDWVTDFSTRRAKAVTIVSLVLIGLALVGVSQLYFRHDVLKWLPEKLPARLATVEIDREMRGSVAIEMILDTGRENGLHRRETLVKLDRLARKMEKVDRGELFVGKVTSVADMLMEINQALNENRPEAYVIPENEKLIPQEFLLFENSGSDDLELVVDSRFQLARFTVKVPWMDTIYYVPFLNELEDMFRAEFGAEVKLTSTGMMTLWGRTVYAAISSMAKSYITALIVISLMMILLIGSFKVGLVAMIPNLAPIILTLGLMGLADFPFDMFTMLVGPIAIGLAVDDTVHFMHNFRRYHYQTGDVVESVRSTLHTAGRAMLVTSVVLSLGFFIFMAADMRNVYYFGLLTGLTVILALLADFFLAPALMKLIHREPDPASEGGV